ncbi:RING-H2 finger protein ATL1-like [Typha latifolia]|uniref:RING-H2 finger protein ATL1-like n=1 Tax=Typha latifolia TaxID=4733 RepID=UPI003C2C06D2
MDSSLSSPPSSSGTSFPIPVAIAIGFVATLVVLIGYYLFVLRFWLNGRHPGLRQLSPTSRRGRSDDDHMPSVFFVDEDEEQGVDPSIVNSIPIVKFRKSRVPEPNPKTSCHECAVCLSEFQEEDSLKLLPSCSHAFHIQCIDTWLRTNVNCPLCRANVSKPIPLHVQASISQQLSNEQIARAAAEASNQSPGDRNWRKISKVESMRDVSIDVRDKDHHGTVRRSFSMDHLKTTTSLSTEGLNETRINGESSLSVHGGDGSRRFRRLIHSFGLGRSSRSAVLPIQIDQL